MINIQSYATAPCRCWRRSCWSLAAAGCGQNDPATLIASAKSYLAKSDYKAAIIELKSALQKAPRQSRSEIPACQVPARQPATLQAAETEVRKAIESRLRAGRSRIRCWRGRCCSQGQSKKLITELGTRKLGSAQARADLGTTLAIAQLSLGDTQERANGDRCSACAKPERRARA